MEKYTFVLEFDKVEELFAYIIDIIKPGRFIRQFTRTAYDICDFMKGEDEKLYEVLKHAPVHVIDFIYFVKQPPRKVVLETFDCPYAYRVEYDDKVKYYLHVEPPMIKPAARAVE